MCRAYEHFYKCCKHAFALRAAGRAQAQDGCAIDGNARRINGGDDADDAGRFIACAAGQVRSDDLAAFQAVPAHAHALTQTKPGQCRRAGAQILCVHAHPLADHFQQAACRIDPRDRTFNRVEHLNGQRVDVGAQAGRLNRHNLADCQVTQLAGAPVDRHGRGRAVMHFDAIDTDAGKAGDRADNAGAAHAARVDARDGACAAHAASGRPSDGTGATHAGARHASNGPRATRATGQYLRLTGVWARSRIEQARGRAGRCALRGCSACHTRPHQCHH